MKFIKDIQRLWQWLGRWGQVLFVALLINSLLFNFGGPEWLRNVAGFIATAAGLVVAAKLIVKVIRHSIWRLRNRLIVTYLFIGLVPILLIATLTLLALWAMSGQVAVYLITSEFNRRMESLRGTAQFVLREPPGRRVERVKQIGAFLSENFPDLKIVLADPQRHTYPETTTAQLPTESWKDATGLVSINGEIHGWINVSSDRGRIMIAVPMTRDFLSSLVPQLGSVSVVTFPQEGVKAITPKKRSASLVANGAPVQVPVGQVPPAVSGWDLEVLWASPTQISDFASPGSQMPALFSVRTRISAVGRVLLSQKADWDSNWALILIYAFGVLFLVIEIVALIVGVSLTRSITNTVHDLYEGTERVKEGDFSHRIRLKGRDQLAQLGASFNGMTERVEQLLQVAKEKERYEAELEIAREIQKQLYPRQVPASPKLKLTALYKPARMVSGDYYDYQRLASDQLVLALGDVAGKGISAALLMATIQSSFRTQIKTCMEQAAAAAKATGSVPVCNLSTSQLTSLLNQHLYTNTPPEKFATFVFGYFDETTNILHYTNAGHLQPILIRRGEAIRLEVDGMVIGAFPFARYGESQIAMEPGDLLVFFTDGISEPENEYGEMYGEDRLTELLLKNAGKSDQEILDMIIDAVERWTGSGELQDDMTLLVARCL